MKIFFDHVLFQQANHDFNHTLVSAIFKENEYDYALDNGWFPIIFWIDQSTEHSKRCESPNEFAWEPIRLSRIVVKDFVLNKKYRRLLKNNISTEIFPSSKVDFEELYQVYLKYVNNKQFEDFHNDFEKFNFYYSREDFQHFLYRINGILHGFCTVRQFGNSLVSYQFCWDYENPKLMLGKFSQIQEIEYAKQMNLDYVYLGCIAENAGLYKSNFPGFEYFTGREWRKKDDLIEKWLNNDSNCTTIEKLCELEKEYIKDYQV